MTKFGSFTSGLLIGALGGGIAALLLTPKNGEENRKLVADYANDVMNNAQGIGDQAHEVIQDGMRSATEISGGFVGSVKSAAETATNQVNDKNDELRAKIEEARDRIAEQVKKNASSESKEEKSDDDDKKVEEKKEDKKDKKDEE